MQKRTPAANRFADKWPPEVQSRGFTQVPNCLFKCRAELGLSTSELSTLMQLLAHDYGSKTASPGHRRLARQAGQSLTTARNNLRTLDHKGFIEIEEHRGHENTYHIMPLITLLRHHQCKHPDKKRTQPS